MPCYHITYPLIMAFNVQENAVFYAQIFKKSPYSGRRKSPPPPPTHPLTPLCHIAPSRWPPLTNPSCTTVTGIAQGHTRPLAPPPPLIGVKEKKRGSRGLIYATSHNLPPNNDIKIMSNKMPFSYTNFQKSPYRAEGKTTSPPPPPPPVEILTIYASAALTSKYVLFIQ